MAAENAKKVKMRRDGTPKQSLARIMKNNFGIIAKVARMGPDYLIGNILMGVVYGLTNSADTVFTVKLFNALDEGAEFGDVAFMIALMAVWNLTTSALHWIYFYVFKPWSKQKLDVRLQRELFLKAYRMDVACYDDPEFYNDFVWAMDEANKRSDEVIDDIGKLVTRIVSMSTLITVMLTIDVPVAIAILAASVLCVLINQMGNRWSFEQEKYWKPLHRVRNYINRVFQLQDHAKEIRTSRVTDLLMRDYDENTEKSVKLAKKYGMKWFLLYGVGWMLVSTGLQFGVLFYMFGKLESGLVLIGAFAASVGVIWTLRWQVIDFVEKAAKFPKHSLFLEKYYGFLAYEPRITTGEAEVPEFSSLELRDVTFTYDFSDKPKYEWHDADWEKPEGEHSSAEALKNVSLSLSRGEKIAIVGYNGACKTTLINLLMRLYDPTSGQILMNGRDIREYDLDAYREKIGVVFQDFKIYAASIAENVMNGDYDPEHDRETVIAALDKAGFSEKLATLEQGVDTTLTREFDKKGTNLSGGEGQKVAIARVFARDYELIIMDEPSSALDPIAEYELNRSILEYAADKTVIFISHRLSTTRMADRIYMFDSGSLIESGSHDELMEMDGKYAAMFRLQAEKYTESVT